MSAYFIDFIVQILFLSTASFLVYTVVDFMQGDEYYYQRTLFEDIFIALIIAVVSIIYFLGGYFIFLEWVMNGQTPGKRIMGIRVLQTTGQAASFSQIVIRNLFRIIDCSYPIQYSVGALSLIFSKKTQRPGDAVAGTIVVKEKKAERALQYSWHKGSVSSVLKGMIPISHEEFEMIVEYIDIHKELSLEDRGRISGKLAMNLVQKHALWKYPKIAELHNKYLEGGSEDRYKPAERILLQIIKHYESIGIGGNGGES